MVERKLYSLTGKLISPMITSAPLIKKGSIWIRAVRDLETNMKPKISYVGKLVKGERRIPNEDRAFRGYVKITTVDANKTRAKKNIKEYLMKEYLGRRTNDGFGKVKWLDYKEEQYQRIHSEPKQKKFMIRKGLGTNYPDELQRLLRALMLHDFVHTEKHVSKIFQEVDIKDKEIREACKNHHRKEDCKNQFLPIVKYFDRLAAYMLRRIRYQSKGRYDYENGSIDFERLTKEIEERQESAYKLYHYIQHSKELERIVESFSYGKNPLKNHLLLMVNLAITNYYNKWLIINNGKIKLAKRISKSIAKVEEDLFDIKDAEMR